MGQPIEPLRAYWQAMPLEDRERFAAECGTTAGHLRNVFGGSKSCSPSLTRLIQWASGGVVMPWHCRPYDWHVIWPELIGSTGAPEVPSAQEAA